MGKHSLFVWLFVFSVKTGTRRIIRPDELSSVVRRSSRTTEDSSSTRIMRLAPVITLKTNNQTNNECLPKFVQTHNASSSIKTAIEYKKEKSIAYILPDDGNKLVCTKLIDYCFLKAKGILSMKINDVLQ